MCRASISMSDPFRALGLASSDASSTQEVHHPPGVELDLEHGGQRIVGVSLREFYEFRGVDAMAWILVCAMGDSDFDEEIDEEIPILRKFYNEFIGEDRWAEDDHTMMTVLNRYDFIKSRGYGNFAPRVQAR
jgi:hypothetical protein